MTTSISTSNYGNDIEIINKLKPKTSYGTDSVSNKLIKLTKDIIANPLTIIINQMIQKVYFQIH